MTLDDPQNAFERIAARAMAKQEASRGRGKTVSMFTPSGKPRFAQESKSDTPDPPANSPEDIGFGDRPEPGSLTSEALERELERDRLVYGISCEERTKDGHRQRIDPRTVERNGDGLKVVRCPSGWDDCAPLQQPWGAIDDPSQAVGLLRESPIGGFPVTRAWSVRGEAFALYDGDLPHRLDELLLELPEEGFVLADEAGAKWLRGELPPSPLRLPKASAASMMGLEHYPYSVVRNVLLACDFKGLLVGVMWASKIDQMKRFGGMPVIAFPPGGARALGYIDWSEVTIRASDKTWELAKDHVKLGVKREGLR